MKENFLRFKKRPDSTYLCTNDLGDHLVLTEQEFSSVKDSGNFSDELKTRLLQNNFYFEDENHIQRYQEAYSKKNHFLKRGPGLHIIAVTLNCDHSCIYCQTSRKAEKTAGYMMDKITAEKTVDFILQTTANFITIEFQGGEPLLNFDIIKHIVEYSKKTNRTKQVFFSIVTNLSLMNEEILSFCSDNEISICTSLDGPEDIHNSQRKCHENGGNSFQNTISWLKKIDEKNHELQDMGYDFFKPNALITVTRDALKRSKEIIDLYRSLGLNSIFLRPISPFGFAQSLHERLLYTPDEFIKFYKESLEYIVQLNKEGHFFSEANAQIILTKIMKKVDPNFLDLRSPCGAAIGQLAYNYNGDIFSCDEGRMLYEMGDSIFKLGNVNDDDYQNLMRKDEVTTLCTASCLEGLPGCHDCVYNPYCGVCPVYNYATQKSIFGHMPANDRCKILMGIFNYIFETLEKNHDVYLSWVESPAFQ